MNHSAESLRQGRYGAFTIVAKNYLPYAMVLAESFLECNPGCEFTCVIVDETVSPFELVDAQAKFIGVQQLSGFVQDFWLMSTMYDVTEFSTEMLLRQILLACSLQPLTLQNWMPRIGKTAQHNGFQYQMHLFKFSKD